ncbi:class II aldolase/adducin family protein [Aliikangiella marina]|uniref:Class II aldolase/adducin family protein n=2 Tax=Aliikangiella marina TaxID=1712262 RepID=A0A545TK61_9GAMM|nr:class II aldolase/adducin family protein [Aliikangiella marina]
MIAQLKQGAIGEMSADSMLLPPTFESLESERDYIKQRLAAAFRLFALYQFDDGLAGHITVRDPIEKETFWVNPVGIHFSRIKVSDLVRLNHEGQLVEGKALVNTAAFMIHSRIHAKHQHINAVAHAHTKFGKAWSTQGRLLDPITQDACVFFESHDVFSQFDGVVHQQSEGDAIADRIGENNIALILQNHGLLTVGIDVDSAVSLFVQLEDACENQLLVSGLPNTQIIPAEIARKTRSFIGSRLVVWGNFQPLYQNIEALQPDFKT